MGLGLGSGSGAQLCHGLGEGLSVQARWYRPMYPTMRWPDRLVGRRLRRRRAEVCAGPRRQRRRHSARTFFCCLQARTQVNVDGGGPMHGRLDIVRNLTSLGHSSHIYLDCIGHASIARDVLARPRFWLDTTDDDARIVLDPPADAADRGDTRETVLGSDAPSAGVPPPDGGERRRHDAVEAEALFTLLLEAGGNLNCTTCPHQCLHVRFMYALLLDIVNAWLQGLNKTLQSLLALLDCHAADSAKHLGIDAVVWADAVAACLARWLVGDVGDGDVALRERRPPPVDGDDGATHLKVYHASESIAETRKRVESGPQPMRDPRLFTKLMRLGGMVFVPKCCELARLLWEYLGWPQHGDVRADMAVVVHWETAPAAAAGATEAAAAAAAGASEAAAAGATPPSAGAAEKPAVASADQDVLILAALRWVLFNPEASASVTRDGKRFEQADAVLRRMMDMLARGARSRIEPFAVLQAVLPLVLQFVNFSSEKKNLDADLAAALVQRAWPACASLKDFMTDTGVPLSSSHGVAVVWCVNARDSCALLNVRARTQVGVWQLDGRAAAEVRRAGVGGGVSGGRQWKRGARGAATI